MSAQTILKIVPRSKQVGGIVCHPPPVEITFENLEEYFLLPLNEAAKKLGVCQTSLKW